MTSRDPYTHETIGDLTPERCKSDGRLALLCLAVTLMDPRKVSMLHDAVASAQRNVGRMELPPHFLIYSALVDLVFGAVATEGGD
jgi:hypothetical protein